MSQSMSTTKASPKSQLYLDDLEIGVTGFMIVMVCRIWDVNATTGRYLSTDFVICDSKARHARFVKYLEFFYLVLGKILGPRGLMAKYLPNSSYEGTPPADVIDTIAETLISTIPRAVTEPEQTKKDTSTVAATIQPRASSAKRSLEKDVSLEAKKRKEIRNQVVAVSRTTYVYLC
nr:hypothetical protein [Tanacetum cinerariifolium]